MSTTLQQHGEPAIHESEFVDRFGNTHRLIQGHRSHIKPGWEGSKQEQKGLIDDEPSIRTKVDDVVPRVNLGVKLLATFGCQLAGQRVLDVGCGEGEEVLCLAAQGAMVVMGSDLDTTGHTDHPGPLPARRMLNEFDSTRRHLIERFEFEGQVSAFEAATVEFRDDDISASALASDHFDVICSWRTLEHLANPQASFLEMFRVLKPGGYAYHEYNPFFALDGGHALVTLDIPWGHVRLCEADLCDYLGRFRPDEKASALDFYRNGLNRMMIADVESMASSAGFEVLALIPRARTEDLLEVTDTLFIEARRNHPGITINDLICRIVRLVLRKPS